MLSKSGKAKLERNPSLQSVLTKGTTAQCNRQFSNSAIADPTDKLTVLNAFKISHASCNARASLIFL